MPGARAEVEVIPCCVDTSRFISDEATRKRVRAELGLGERLTIVYSGSVASWYMDREMARFVGFAKRIREDIAFLVLTPSPTDDLRGFLGQAGVAPGDVIARSIPPTKMPEMLCAADLGLSFIKPCFSKIGSSPTKVAEYLACGVPVVLNGGIGDQNDLATEDGACVVIPSFEDPVLQGAAQRGIELAHRPYVERALLTRQAAERNFSLSRIGVPRYTRLYASLCR
jgi:glycosyltransferase involved in cell wall biosynthesis